MNRSLHILVLALFWLQGYDESPKEVDEHADFLHKYPDLTERDDQLTGGMKMIPITTPKGKFKVWTAANLNL